MALVLNSSRLRLTTANWFGDPHGGGGSISLTEGAGITLNPDPIVGSGSIALTVPVGVVNGGTGTVTAFTQGSVVFAGAAGAYSQSNANFFWDGANFRLGLGTTTPLSRFHLAGTTTATSLVTLERASGDASSAYIKFAKERGTLAVPVAVNTADSLGQMIFNGWGGATGYVSAASIMASATGTIADTRVPGELSFWTGTDALPSVLTKRLTIDNAGKVGIATDTPTEQLDVRSGNIQSDRAFIPLAPGLSAFPAADANKTWVYRTSAAGVGYPFLEAGHLVLQSRQLDDRGILFATGATTSVKAVIDGLGNLGVGVTAPARLVDVAATGSLRAKLQDYGGRVISVDAYGALADAVENTTASVPVGTPNLTLGSVVASNGFSTSDIGKPIAVQGAGAAGGVLTTTVAAVGAGAEGQKTTCTLNTVALTECVSGRAVWGTDNTVAVQAAFNANVDQARGHTIEFSSGNYLVNGAISLPNQNTTVRGQGKGATYIYQISTTANTFDVTFTGASIEFENFTICGMGPKCTGGHAIGWTGAAGPYFECLVSNVQIKDVYTALECTYEGSVGMRVTNTEIIGTSGDSVRWDGGIEAENVLIYQVTTGPTGVAASIGVGTNTFTMTSGTVSSKDVGKKIGIYGAGGSATTPLITTIASVTSGTAGTTTANATSTAVAQMTTIEYPAPSCWHVMNGGPMLRNVHMIGGDYGLWISPDTGDTVQWLFADALDCDSSRLYGLYIAPTGTGNAQMFQINNSWFASSAMGGWAGRAENTAAIKLVGQAGTPINGVSISDSTIGHNAKYGVHSDRCFNLTFDNCTIDTNSILLANTYDHIYVDNCGNFSIKNSGLGSRYSSFGVTTNCRYGVVLTANVNGHITITGNSFTQFGTGALSDASTVTTKTINDNVGLNPMTIVTPAVPATTVAASNTTGSDIMVYIVTDGATTVTVIAVNGTTTGQTMAVSSQKAMLLPAGGTITLTYAGGTPTWTWIGS